jgi:hypothetical protein
MPLFTPKCKDEDIVKVLKNLFSRDLNTKQMAKIEMNKLLLGKDLKCKRTSAQKDYLDIYQKLFSELNMKQSDEDLERQVIDLANKWQNEIREKNKVIRDLNECKRTKTALSPRKKQEKQYAYMPVVKTEYGQIPNRAQKKSPSNTMREKLLRKYSRPKLTPLQTPDALKINDKQFDELFAENISPKRVQRPLPPIPQKKK